MAKTKQSVKAICEEGIRKGNAKGVIMNKLRKECDKDDETYEHSIKYYASALARKGDIDEDAKAKYVGAPGRAKSGKTPAVSKADTKSSRKAARAERKKSKDKADSTAKTPRKASKSDVSGKPKRVRKGKTDSAETVEKAEKPAKKQKAQS